VGNNNSTTTFTGFQVRLKPSGHNRQNSSLKECFFINSALKIQWHIVKNTFLQTAFSVIFSIGKGVFWVLEEAD